MPRMMALEGTTYSGLTLRPWDMNPPQREPQRPTYDEQPPCLVTQVCGVLHPSPCRHIETCREQRLACAAFYAYIKGSEPRVFLSRERIPGEHWYERSYRGESSED